MQKNTESSLGEPGILFIEGGGPSIEVLVGGGGPSSTLRDERLVVGLRAGLVLYLLSVLGGRTGFTGEAGLGGGGGGGSGTEGGVGTGAVGGGQ